MQFDFPNEEGKPYKSSGGKMVYNPILKREIPEGWEVQTLQKVSTICRGSIITEAQTHVGSVKVVAAAITYSYLHDIANRSANVITISSSGANAGYMNFWRESIFASDCITVQCEKDIDTILTYHQLELYRDAIMKKSRGSAQPHVYPSDIESLPCICVPDYLKNMVCKLFISYNKQIASNSIEIEALTKQRDELLPLLMNGQVNFDLSVKVLVPIQIFGTRKLFFKKIHSRGKPCKYYTSRVLYIPFYPPNSPIVLSRPMGSND